MIDGDHGLSITGQAKALGISRGSVYYLPRPVSPADLAVMRRIDELHLEFPFAGSRMLRDLLNREGVEIGRRQCCPAISGERSDARAAAARLPSSTARRNTVMPTSLSSAIPKSPFGMNLMKRGLSDRGRRCISRVSPEWGWADDATHDRNGGARSLP